MLLPAYTIDLTIGDDWIARTSRGELCALIGCEEIPSVKCEECENWYCDEHTESHPHNV